MPVGINLHNTLCLACFSSLLSEKQVAHITKCCQQIICDACIQINPRLAIYQPCLMCLGGVGASGGKFQSQQIPPHFQSTSSRRMINSDETMFVLGEDSDEESEERKCATEESGTSPCPLPKNLPPSYHETFDPESNHEPQLSSMVLVPPEPDKPSPVSEIHSRSALGSQTYYIDPCDTIHGIALRFGVDARDLCRTNNLPFSTLNTTPHLLHTRTFLTLPPPSKPVPLQYVLSEEDRAKRHAQRSKERAEKRLQMVTKEIDLRVAKTYVAIAENFGFEEATTNMSKEGTDSKVPIFKSTTGQSLEALDSRAIDLYLDDGQWEQNELNVGCSPHPHRFPISTQNATPSSSSSGFGTKAKWWPWNHDAQS